MVSTQSVSGKTARKPQGPLERLNARAAGIDIGAHEHYVAIPADLDEQPVRTFGCFTPDLHEMARWLKERGIETVAMESTGVYWIPVYRVLEEHGLDVRLVHARHVRCVPGRKTDVLDCQWLQELHSFGLLSSCFVVPGELDALRTLWRHRESLVASAGQQIQLMHKALEQMNMHLHKVLSDLSGVTGMAIIRAIVAGERDALALARFRHGGCKSNEETIVKALSGNWRPEHLFTLGQALALFDIYQDKIRECDQQIEEMMAAFPTRGEPDKLRSVPSTTRRKNQPHFDLRSELYRMTGVDLTAIDGIEALTAQTVITECGIDLSAFPTEKHFASWLCLCPNNRKTGGKVKGRSTRRAQNRAATSLRLAAQSLHHSKSALGAYFRRMKARRGAPKAITATAHRLACLVYRMLRYGAEYVDEGCQHYEEQHRERELLMLTRRAKSLGYNLVSTTDGAIVS